MRYVIILLFAINLNASINAPIQSLASRVSCVVTPTGCTFTLGASVIAHHSLLVMAMDQISANTLSITMTGESFTTAAGYPTSPGVINQATIAAWFISNAVGGQTSFTILPTTGGHQTFVVAVEISSTNGGGFTDDTSTFHNGTCSASCSNTVTTSSITPSTSTNDLIFSLFFYAGGTASTTCTPNNSFITLQCNPAGYNRGSSSYLITSDTSAHTPSETLGGIAVSNWGAMAMMLKEPSGGGGTNSNTPAHTFEF